MARPWKRPLGQGVYVCVKCGTTKGESEFRTKRGYINAYCRSCSVERTRQWREVHRDELRQRSRMRWARATPEQRAARAERKRRALAQRRELDPPTARACGHCGTSFVSAQPHARWCSRRCKDGARSVSHNNARRARKAGVRLVVAVDADYCGVCLKPLTDRAWPDPMSTSVGHEPPLARAAEDGWSIVSERPEHLGCNLSKGARYDAELAA